MHSICLNQQNHKPFLLLQFFKIFESFAYLLSLVVYFSELQKFIKLVHVRS